MPPTKNSKQSSVGQWVEGKFYNFKKNMKPSPAAAPVNKRRQSALLRRLDISIQELSSSPNSPIRGSMRRTRRMSMARTSTSVVTKTFTSPVNKRAVSTSKIPKTSITRTSSSSVTMSSISPRSEAPPSGRRRSMAPKTKSSSVVRQSSSSSRSITVTSSRSVSSTSVSRRTSIVVSPKKPEGLPTGRRALPAAAVTTSLVQKSKSASRITRKSVGTFEKVPVRVTSTSPKRASRSKLPSKSPQRSRSQTRKSKSKLVNKSDEEVVDVAPSKLTTNKRSTSKVRKSPSPKKRKRTSSPSKRSPSPAKKIAAKRNRTPSPTKLSPPKKGKRSRSSSPEKKSTRRKSRSPKKKKTPSPSKKRSRSSSTSPTKKKKKTSSTSPTKKEKKTPSPSKKRSRSSSTSPTKKASPSKRSLSRSPKKPTIKTPSPQLQRTGALTRSARRRAVKKVTITGASPAVSRNYKKGTPLRQPKYDKNRNISVSLTDIGTTPKQLSRYLSRGTIVPQSPLNRLVKASKGNPFTPKPEAQPNKLLKQHMKKKVTSEISMTNISSVPPALDPSLSAVMTPSRVRTALVPPSTPASSPALPSTPPSARYANRSLRMVETARRNISSYREQSTSSYREQTAASSSSFSSGLPLNSTPYRNSPLYTSFMGDRMGSTDTNGHTPSQLSSHSSELSMESANYDCPDFTTSVTVEHHENVTLSSSFEGAHEKNGHTDNTSENSGDQHPIEDTMPEDAAATSDDKSKKSYCSVM